MASKVYFTNLRASQTGNLLQKLERLVKHAGIDKIDYKDKFVALKIHFGEYGNVAYIRPNYAAVIVKLIKDLGGKPFLTDSNTLYSGSRDNAVDHIHTAMVNGFNPIATGCDVIIADGLRGKDERAIDVQGKYCPAPKIGSAIAEADIVISLTHFKGHEMAGFGGALKNLGMGSGSVAGKLDMHSTAQPKIDTDNCIGCRLCEKNCNHDAIHVVNVDVDDNGNLSASTSTSASSKPRRVAVIDYDKCVGCGQCIAICKSDGAQVGSNESAEILNYKIAEYTKAVLKDKPHFHISFIMNVSPECDCWGHNDAAIVPDLGMACSFDPVALDQACVDIVNAAPALRTENMFNEKTEGLRINDGTTGIPTLPLKYIPTDSKENDKFHHLHPNTNWQAGLRYAEEIGIGTRDYELVKI